MSTPAPGSSTVARRALELFAAAEVPAVFGIPGVHNLAFWRDGTPDCPPIIGVRHEQTTVYAADGLARATGGLGVALTTTGPGAANAAGAFGEAAACGSPVVLLASEVNSRYVGGVQRGVLHQSRDQAGIFEPLAKAVLRPRTADEAVVAVGDAIRTAMAWPRGPVYLDVPTDVLSHPAAEASLIEPSRAQPAPGELRELADLVNQSARVVIWCGGGVVQSGAEDALIETAELLGAPVVTTYAARGVIPPGHDSHVSLPPHEPEVAQLVADADLLLAVGTDFDGMMTRNWSMPMPGALAVVNCAEEDLRKNYDPDVAVLGDARETLQALRPLLSKRDDTLDLSSVARGWDRLAADPREAEAVQLLRRIEAALTPETSVACDMAVAGYWFGGYGAVPRSRRLQYPVGWGTLGYALPAAIGPAAAGSPTLAICGDGGVMFALSELATIAQESLPVTTLVVDDGAYGMLAFDQEVAGDQRSGVDLLSPDWAALGAAFGLPTTVLDTVGDDLTTALSRALTTPGGHLVVLRAGLLPPRTTSARWSS